MLSDKVIEEYQMILMRDPSAQVFAPLAEAYRKIGLLQQALEICEKGVKYNPNYPSGFVAHGKTLFELKRYEEASLAFQKAIAIKADNILAHKLNALSLIKLNQFQEALQAYKHVLFLNPNDETAQKFINNWDYLEAQSYSEPSFALPVETEVISTAKKPESVAAFIEALIARNEIDKSENYLLSALQKWPQSDILQHQLTVVQDFKREEAQSRATHQLQAIHIKKMKLEDLLRRIELVRQG